MADTNNLLYALPSLVQFEVPFVEGDLGWRNYISKHAVTFQFSSNLAASRRLTGNPGLPVDPQIVSGFEAKAVELAYMSNLCWDVIGGVPVKPVFSQFASGVTGDTIKYFTDPNE